MAKNILIPIDSSKNAMRVAEYAAHNIEKEASITLYHVFLKTPYEQVTVGNQSPHHSVSFSGSTREFLEWVKQKRSNAEQMLEEARNKLIEAGISEANITLKIDESKQGVVEDILNELAEGNYSTLIIGRGNRSGLKGILKKNIAGKIADYAKGSEVLFVDNES